MDNPCLGVALVCLTLEWITSHLKHAFLHNSKQNYKANYYILFLFISQSKSYNLKDLCIISRQINSFVLAIGLTRRLWFEAFLMLILCSYLHLVYEKIITTFLAFGKPIHTFFSVPNRVMYFKLKLLKALEN